MAKERPDIVKMTQFEMLDAFSNKKCVPTPFGPRMIHKVLRLSEHEYNIWLRPPMMQYDLTCFYLKFNKRGFLNVIYRFSEEGK